MVIVIILHVFLAGWLIRYLIRRDTGPREPFVALAYAGLLGVFAVVNGAVLELFIIPSSALPVPSQPAVHVRVLTIILGCLAIGVIEELSKALPLKRLIVKKG